eukprot:COSAG01_NODE_1237_length_11098_cov_7.982726_2_plen_129_part_00
MPKSQLAAINPLFLPETLILYYISQGKCEGYCNQGAACVGYCTIFVIPGTVQALRPLRHLYAPKLYGHWSPVTGPRIAVGPSRRGVSRGVSRGGGGLVRVAAAAPAGVPAACCQGHLGYSCTYDTPDS